MSILMRRLMATALLLPAAVGHAQLPPPDAPVRVEQVAPGIHVLFGAGGNIGVSSGPDGVFMIDDQFAPMAPRIEAALKTLSPQSPRFVLNTHWHGDHTGGNEVWGKAGAVIVAQDNVRTRMSVPQFVSLFGTRTTASPPAALPVITFSATTTFHFNGEEIHAAHVPNAHTDGDVIVHFRKADVFHLGDTFFRGTYPFIDVDSGGSSAGMIASADKVLALADADTRIIPGHGPVATRADLQAYRDMLAATRAAVKALFDAGRTVEEAVAAKPTAAYDAEWGGQFIKPDVYVRMLYSDLSRSSN